MNIYIKKHTKYIFYDLIFFHGNTGIWTQGLGQAGIVLLSSFII
jgi:hypothetical protein